MLKEPRPTKAELKRHSKFIRELGICAASSYTGGCGGEIQSCHIRKGFFCMSRKPEKREIPMCALHHTIQHSIGEEKFFGRRGGVERFMRLALDLHAISGDTEKAKELLREFRK